MISGIANHPLVLEDLEKLPRASTINIRVPSEDNWNEIELINMEVFFELSDDEHRTIQKNVNYTIWNVYVGELVEYIEDKILINNLIKE